MALHIHKKRFGQHFLVDETVLESIVDSIAPDTADTVVEIGPGAGALTHRLLERVGVLHAIEIDRDLQASLQERWGERDGFVLHTGDALTFDYGALDNNNSNNSNPWRCVGNLPYNISTPLLVKLFAHDATDMHFLLQAEVAERLSASAGSKSYGRLSLAVQLYGEVEIVLRVPPEAFDPPPKVQSALVRIQRKNVQGPRDFQVFDTLVRQVFSQRRKMLRRSLGDEDVLQAAGVEPTARPEQLCLDDFVRLSDLMSMRKRGD